MVNKMEIDWRANIFTFLRTGIGGQKEEEKRKKGRALHLAPLREGQVIWLSFRRVQQGEISVAKRLIQTDLSHAVEMTQKVKGDGFISCLFLAGPALVEQVYAISPFGRNDGTCNRSLCKKFTRRMTTQIQPIVFPDGILMKTLDISPRGARRKDISGRSSRTL